MLRALASRPNQPNQGEAAEARRDAGRLVQGILFAAIPVAVFHLGALMGQELGR